MRWSALLPLIILASLVTVTVVGCAAPGIDSAAREPTMTAIPLPSNPLMRPTATALSARVAATVPAEKPAPTTTTLAIRQPTHPPTEPSPTMTTTASATLSPSPTVTAVTPTPRPKPAQSKPQPTPTSELRGKLVIQTTIGDLFWTINADGSDLRSVTDGVDPI